MSFVVDLSCTRCEKTYPSGKRAHLCECGAPLFTRYDLDSVSKSLTKESLLNRPKNLWRYSELLPVEKPENRLSLGEGFTPLHTSASLANELGLNSIFIKDESLNPTGSFKARGMAAALSMAKELGLNKICLPTAGNAGGAAAAYGANGGMEIFIAMPESTPRAFVIEAEMLGAKIKKVPGSIADAGKYIRENLGPEWYDVSTLKEPYRVEGKKTLGLEIAEQMNWQLPDVIVYPTGGGTGLVGMWKAFDELEKMGWIPSKRPRMVSVQAEGCAPIVRAFEQGLDHAPVWENPTTAASGLRVPGAVADFILLDILRKSQGTAVAVSEEDIQTGTKTIGASTGIFSSPEGGAVFAAAKKLIERTWIGKKEKIVLFITGSGLKYIE